MTNANFATGSSALSVKDRLLAQAQEKKAAAASATNKKEGMLSRLSDKAGALYMLNPNLINVKPNFNSRDFSVQENIEHVEALARSIAEVGVKQPVVVFMENNEVFLSDGECRLRAALLAIEDGAMIETIPVILESRFSSAADHIFSQIVRNSGKDLTALEKGVNFKKLIDLGWSEKDIATKSGMSINHVVQILEMNAAPREIKEMVTDGRVAFTLAFQTYKANNNDSAKTVAALESGLVVAEASGKSKVTAKHLKAAAENSDEPNGEVSPRLPMKKVLKNIFKAASVSKVDRDTDTVTVVLSSDDYSRLKGLLGL